jgi:hypothetical protein
MRVKMPEAQVEMEEEGFDLILSLDDTDVEKDDKTSPIIRQSTDAFTTNEVIAVLERISWIALCLYLSRLLISAMVR